MTVIYYEIYSQVGEHLYNFVCAVENELVAKSLCNKHSGWIYNKVEDEASPFNE